MIFDHHANLKYKYGNRHFWCRGYYVDTVGKYEGAIKEYIKNQMEHHKRVSFREEYLQFLQLYNIEYDERYVFTD